MSAVENVTQGAHSETGLSLEDLVIMDYNESDKEPAVAEEACTQTDRCHGRRGRCWRRKMLRKQHGDVQSEDESCHFRCDRRRMKKKAMKWMRKMMMRRMMMRMCYGPPRFGFGLGCRRRRMMSAMMDGLDTTTSDDSRSEAEDCCGRRRRCGRQMHPRRVEKPKEGQVGSTDKQPEGTGTQTKLHEKDGNGTPGATEKLAPAPTDGAVQKDQAERTQRKVCFREERRHGRCMGRRRRRYHHHCQSSSGTSSSSDSSSDSSSSSSPEAEDVQCEKEKRCRRRRDGGAQGRDGGAQGRDGGAQGRDGGAQGREQAVGDQETRKEKKCKKGDRKAWKGRKFQKKIMKDMHKGYYRRFC